MKKFLLFVLCFGLFVSPGFSFAQVVINEIMYNPDGTDTGYEWIELHNVGASDVDITGWKFTEAGVDHGLTLKQGALLVPAGGFAVIVGDLAKFLSIFNFSGNIFYSSFSLSNDGEPLEIKDKDKIHVDGVTYSRTQGAYDNGNSLQKINIGWISASPTPGIINATVDTEANIDDGGSGTGGTGTTTATSTDTTATTTSTTTASTSRGGSYYVYSSPSYLSTYEPMVLSVEAGRERLGFLHTPMQFKSNAFDKKTGQSVYGARYYWTFGDGSSAEGGDVNHTYLFPGEYNVVLNTYSGNEDAVDITKVKIISPQIKIVYSNSYIEFTNESSSDLNIGGWKVKGNDKEYLIPRDTIISTKASLKISEQLLGGVFGGEKLLFMYPDNQLVAEIKNIAGEEKQRQIAEISQKLVSAQKELDLAYSNSDERNLALGNQYENSELGLTGVPEDDKVEGKKEDRGNVANVASSPASQNVLSKIVDFFATMFR